MEKKESKRKVSSGVTITTKREGRRKETMKVEKKFSILAFPYGSITRKKRSPKEIGAYFHLDVFR